MFRSAIIFLMLGGAMSADLAPLYTEPNLEKRSDKAIEYAREAVEAARDSYKRHDYDNFRTCVEEVAEAVELSYKSLLATGKAARRHP
ncbi:MAG: hypothetical protein HYS04_16375, partial [Acidobacteria bacterium]|nr:hypothetical protein [Acidobacteriota bacterium]